MTTKAIQSKKIPKTIKVAACEYEVISDPEIMRQTNNEEGHKALGYTDPTKTAILLEPEMSESMCRETLFHELMHACFYANGGRAEFGSGKEERFINFVSSTMLDTLQRNPKLREYLFNDS